jgi:asparagine synthase (glutamine-hydrolysing)
MAFGDLITVFNGEIYNFREVEKELEARGYSFTSSSDTEVLLKAFHCWGPRCVDRFIGMFAIAIWDKATRTMYLIRDRAGVKPLYYYNQGDRLAFGSELGSLKPYLTPAERGAIDMNAVSEFLSFGYISGGLSIIESVKKVPQGHYLTFREATGTSRFTKRGRGWTGPRRICSTNLRIWWSALFGIGWLPMCRWVFS